MALLSLRVRRTLTTLTTIHRTLSVSNPTIPAITTLTSNSTRTPPPSTLISSFCIFQCRWFRSSEGPLSSPRQYKLYKEGDEITEDTVLFEGCDYNHWLIVVDFPKNNKPPPEEMIRTYENICAQGLRISVEEAKKRIYACSTTTYEGFQVLMSEEESEKFNDIPGVVFVLPDSYIDPVKKEYGGDKYENGVITPRPPPIQYARNQGGKFRQNQPRYDRQGSPMPNQGNPPYNQQGFVQGDGRNYRPPQNFPPQQNYGQQPPMNNRDYAPRGSDPSYQGSFNQGGQGNYNSQERRDFFQGEQRNYNSQERRDFFQGEQRNYMPPQQKDFRGDHRNIDPSQGGNYEKRPSSGYGQNFGQGANPGYEQNSGQGAGQGANPGYAQNSGHGQSYGQGSNHGFGSGQRANPAYGQTYPGHGAGQGFSQAEQRNMQGEPTGSKGQGGVQQGRY